MTDTRNEEKRRGAAHAATDALIEDRTVDALLAELASDDVVMRRRARNTLVAIGEPALPEMLEELAHGEFPVRWEVAKTLGEMRHPRAVPGLIEALEDKEQDVRWLAAVALAAIGREAIEALLEALIERSDSGYLRQGVHHVLTIYRDWKLEEPLAHVRDALGPLESGADAIPAAEGALRALHS
jgi:HEAT repeat protein